MLNPIICLDDIQRIENLPQPLVIKTLQEVEIEYSEKNILPHRQNFYTIVLVQSAEGEHLIDFTTYKIQPNTIYFISQEQIYHVKLKPNPRGFMLMFNDDFLIQSGIYTEFMTQLSFFYTVNSNEPLQITEEISKLYHQIVKALYRETEKFDEFTNEITGTLLKLFFLGCQRIYKTHHEILMTNANINRAFSIVQEFKMLVNLHFATKHKVSDYATLMNLTGSYLNQTIKQEIDATPKDLITQRIMLEAKKLALFTEMSAKDIATSLGFDDPAHFSKLFKNTEKINFSNFRENYVNMLAE
jgi:AraC family transcriptional activator of pobA